MSFWKDFPGPSWSDCFWSTFSCSTIPFAHPIRRTKLPKPPSGSYQIVLAKPHEASEISDFLQLHFQITPLATCKLPPERLLLGIQTNWIVLLAKQNGILVGVIISRPLGTLTFHFQHNKSKKQSTFSSCDSIDFFCIEPNHRKSGLGSLLLRYIDHLACEYNRPIHFFQKELTPLTKCPPLWCGTYIVREVFHSSSNHTIQQFSRPHSQMSSNSSLFRITVSQKEKSLDTLEYSYNCGNFVLFLAITNSYHTFRNQPVGEVLYYRVSTEDNSDIARKSIAAALEEILESSSFSYILMDESFPHLKQMSWKKDAPYYIYCYNVNPRKFFSVHPEFWY